MELNFLKPAPHITLLPENEHARLYRKYRIRNFICIFLGYACYYLLRRNYSLAMPYLASMGFSTLVLGEVMTALPIAYGISKFIMGNLSDRSNARYFIVLGLLFSIIINLFIGYVPGIAINPIPMAIMLFLNGWAQGMGAPPCYRTVAHWFPADQKGKVMSVWNVAHNLGAAGLGLLVSSVLPAFDLSWRSIFSLPAIIVAIATIIIVFLMTDTPQSVGLPSVEEFEKEKLGQPVNKKSLDKERELSAKEILFKYVLVNKYIWCVAFANIFVYFIRYGVADWAPTYLTKVKGLALNKGGVVFMIYEMAGIVGMLLCGYISDVVFKGNRAIVSILCMLFVALGVFTYWHSSSMMITYAAIFLIGTFIYGPVMLVGVQVLDLMPKKAVGTAIGLLGLFGYWGGNFSASYIFGYVTNKFGWNYSFTLLFISCLLAIACFSFTLKAKKVVD